MSISMSRSGEISITGGRRLNSGLGGTSSHEYNNLFLHDDRQPTHMLH